MQAKAYIDAAKAAAADASRAVTTSHFSAAAFRPSSASTPAARSARSAASAPFVLPPTEASVAAAASGQYAAQALSQLTSLMGDMQGALRRNSVHDRTTAVAVPPAQPSVQPASKPAAVLHAHHVLPASAPTSAAAVAPASALSFYRGGGNHGGHDETLSPANRAGGTFLRHEGAVVSEPSEDSSSLASAAGASFGGASVAQEAAHNAMLASRRCGGNSMTDPHG